MGQYAKVRIWMTWALMLVGFAVPGLCGSLEDPGPPSSTSSAMHTLTGIYNRLTTNATETKRSGAFKESSSGTGSSTGYTLNQVYDKAIPTQVGKTGQTTSYGTGDDGALQKGVAWPSPRFTDNSNGMVTDNLTGLIWLKNANCWGSTWWDTAVANPYNLASGTCGLTDGSTTGMWRLPNRYELRSLLDMAFYSPALSNAAGTAQWSSGNAFSAVASGTFYWSSTTYVSSTSTAWAIYLGQNGALSALAKTNSYSVWPVRGGQ